MSYTDEEILKQRIGRKTAEMKGEENSEEEIKPQGEVLLKETELYEGKLKIKLPEDAEALTEEGIRATHPHGNPPQHSYVSLNAGVSISFHHTITPLKETGVAGAAGFAGKFLEKNGAGVTVFGKKIISLGDKKLAVLEAVSRGMDGGVFNLFVYASMEDRLLLLNISMPAKEAEKKKKLAYEILESIEIIEEP
ncbi:MAG: hypothetical protein NC412_05055 [Roseburia sp.]|nr:hypothetical protein [Roseburia sp.]MCM1277618.1 hypothetical protein [Robinsoniella sp.]